MTHTPNFLETPGAPVGYRPRRWPALVAVIFLVVILAGGLLARPIRAGLRAVDAARAGKAALDLAMSHGAVFNFEEASRALEVSGEQFRNAKTELGALRGAFRVPWLGRQLRATDAALAAGIEAIAAAREVLSFGQDLFSVFKEIESTRAGLTPSLAPTATLASLSREEKRMILARFTMSLPKLEAARARIDVAFERFNQIPATGLVAPLARALEPLRDELPRLRADLDRAVPLASLVPAFAGYPEPREILILFLNNAELRPGGGFIGTVGRLEIADGTVLSLVTKDAYAIDRPAEAFLNIPAPAPIARYLNVPRWFMRDANWSPDFTVAGETVIDFYERETAGGTPTGAVDSLIAFTPSFASEILRITGPITVEGQTFTADNLFETLEYQVEQGFTERGVPHEQRKEILAKLVDATIARLTTLPFTEWEKGLAALDRAFREKQFMLYARDTAVQTHIDAQGWAGRVEPGGGDFFMVVDANLGSLKSDPAVKRRINYHLEPDRGGYRATVAITYRHEGRFDWKTTRYRTYTRLYVPAGSVFLSAAGALRDDTLKNPARESGTIDVGRATDLGVGEEAEVFGAFTAIEPGEERTLSFTYQLAPQAAEAIRAGTYALRVQKQLGAFPHELTLGLDFGKTLVSATPAEAPEDFFDTRYRIRTDLAEDRYFEVRF